MDPAGGSIDWLQRPVRGTITAALVIGGPKHSATIRILGQEQTFGEFLGGEVVDSWVDIRGSIFRMTSS